jgi:very-short-patch-repair endonuclease
MSRNAPEPRDVLVAWLPQPADLDLARDRGFYRIRPGAAVNRLGDLERFRTIGFYQPDSFGTERRRIRYYAEVRLHEMVRRQDLLPDAPDHSRASDLYHCFRLEGLQEFVRPIRSDRGRRLLFHATTAERLFAATEINDLFLGNPLEERMYARLKHSGLRPEREYWVQYAQQEARGRKQNYFLDFAVLCRKRNLAIECDGDRWHANPAAAQQDNERANLLEANGWHILRFRHSDIFDGGNEAPLRVCEAIDEYGGIEEPTGVIRRFGKRRVLGPGQASLPLYGSEPPVGEEQRD